MRRAITLAIVLALSIGTAAQAASPPSMAVGHVRYETPGGLPRALTLVADAGTQSGMFIWWLGSTRYAGTLTCVQVDGADAWAAGPMTTDEGAIFIWVHDGGRTSGDTAFVWGSDPNENLGDMEALCEEMPTDPYGYAGFPVLAGSIVVR